MLDDKTLIPLYNRSINGTVGYVIPDRNVTRNFAEGETKKVTMDELRSLMWVPGGEVTLRDYLIVQNQEAVEELLGSVEPEYYYTSDDIKNLLVSGTMDQLEDCLNFAPAGVLETVKDIAIQISLGDMNKRKLIGKKLGFDIHNAITHNEQSLAAMGVDEPEEKPTRKAGAAKPIPEITTGRKAAPIKASGTIPVIK